ncbi:variant erythrocyte surface antigen-1 family protein [Babesia caballi]|uniref:Variant erythrocyte surface antigen-1 family protein n=1 Tax=Babesia caballi TaxID=5871 RepID=A0AAV4LUY4_BABCB|nr:variant erythrocyte surface antigen-1 family protein [Babesia caballi]
MSAGTSGKQLTDCPSNLKEAIDWILRVTGKDGQRGGDSTKGLADAFEKLLQGVKASDSTLQEKFQEIKQALKIDGNNGIVNALGEGLKKFRDDIHQTKGHQNNVYKELNSHPNLATEVPKAAKIFFGCVPLCFYGLSYLYWRCSDKGGGWHDQRFSSTGIHTDLKDFMVGMGFKSSELNGSMAGSKIVGTPFTKLQQFKTISANKTSYPALLKSIQMSPSPTLNQHPLSSLHLLASTYFTHKQSKADSPPTGSPKSIREMLYFLAALPFSSVYDAFDTYITDHFKTLLKKPEEANDENLKLDVADSSKPSSGGNDTLSAAELKQYLHTSCSFSAIVLGRFQGHGITGNDSDDPWLHKLFCNSEFAFNFPSTPILFSKLSEYTYALQFQLTFLHEQCSRSPVHGCEH